MKTVLITGATDGIGQETARQLLARGLRVLVHGRSQAKAEQHAQALAAGQPGAQALAVWGDLASMRQVVTLAEQVRALAPKLDVLINNAGVFEKRRQLTEDGFERTMAVNHFAPYLLTRRLGPAVQAAPAGRIVVVASMAHSGGELALDDLTFARGYDGYGAYSTSKLANILFTRALAQRLEGTHVTVNALHPGVIGTKLLRAGFGMGGASVAEGARTSVYLATSDEVEGVSGRYFVDCREANPSRDARDRDLAEGLWRESERLLAGFL
jgi:NAD(P)-dependent dehydrogenase (short-subunit alcohol dehydrogenase family)